MFYYKMSLPDARNLTKRITPEKHKIFKKMLKNCSEKIKYTNDKCIDTSIMFMIPKIITEVSDYNVLECTNYIKEKLEKNHYNVLVSNNVMYISWSSVYTSPSKTNEFDDLLEIKKKFPNAKLEYIVKN